MLPYHTDRIIVHLFLKTNTLTPLVCLSLLAHSVFLLQFGLPGRVKEVLLQAFCRSQPLNISYSKHVTEVEDQGLQIRFSVVT